MNTKNRVGIGGTSSHKQSWELREGLEIAEINAAGYPVRVRWIRITSPDLMSQMLLSLKKPVNTGWETLAVSHLMQWGSPAK